MISLPLKEAPSGWAIFRFPSSLSAFLAYTARWLLSGPDIVSRGFVYVRESEELMDEVRALATQAINDCLDRRDRIDRMELKTCVKDALSKYLYAKTKRKPMVLPVITNV